MLIKVDVFEGTSTTTPSRPTLYSCVGTTIRRYYSDNDNEEGNDDDNDSDEDNNPNAGLLLSVGRKGDSNDILFPSEKSVSKNHFQIRCMSSSSSSSSRVLRGCMTKPRNKQEEEWKAACSEQANNNNENHMCLVLDDPSKAGVFIAQPKRPKKPVVGDDDGDGDKKEDDAGGDDGSDSDTDVEDSGGGGGGANTKSSTSKQQQQKNSNGSMSGSITTTTNNLAYPTMATKEFVAKNYSHYYNNNNNPQGVGGSSGSSSRNSADRDIEIDMIPVTFPVKEPGSIILPLGQYKGRDEDENEENGNNGNEEQGGSRSADSQKLRVDSVSNRVIMIQLTTDRSITIRIEWIPIRVVFSSVSDEIKNSLIPNLYKIGATVQSQVIAPCNNGTGEGKLRPTTHLVASQFSPVPKQLTAWALNLPFVSPEWLSDMITKTATKISKEEEEEGGKDGNGNILTTVLPFHCRGGPNDDGTTPTNPKYIPVEGSTFASKKPSNKDLLSQCTLLIQNENDDNGDAERLGGAGGMNIVRLYELKTQKLKKQRITELITSSSKNNEDSVIVTTSKLSSKLVTTASAKNAIQIIRVRDIAKAISSQSSKLVDMIKKKDQSQSPNDTTANGKNSSNNKNVDDDDEDEDMEIEIQAGQSQAPLLLERDFVKNDEKTKKKDEIDAKISSKNNDLSVLQEEEEDKEEEEDINDEEKSSGKNSKTVTKESQPSSSSSTETKRPLMALGRANAMGWYTVAPKDDATRFKMRQKASQVYAEQNGRELEDPVSSMEIIHVKDVPPLNSTTSTTTTTTLGRRGDNSRRGPNDVNNGGPDFRKFRKNYVVIPDIDDYVVLKEDDAAPNNAKDAVRHQMSEQQRLLEEEQRQADELFFGTGGGPGRGTGAKRRRRT